MTSDKAVRVINELVTARLCRFERAVSTELPVLFDELRLGAGCRQRLLGYVEALQDWMAGDPQWSRVTGRYHTVPWVHGRLTRLGGPTRMGATL